MFGKASWKSYVFEINNSTHLKYSGGKQVSEYLKTWNTQCYKCP